MVGGRTEGNYESCGGNETIYFKTSPKTTHYISDVRRRFFEGKIGVIHSKGSFETVKQYLDKEYPNLAKSVVNEPFTRATSVTSCEPLPSLNFVPIYLPSKKK